MKNAFVAYFSATMFVLSSSVVGDCLDIIFLGQETKMPPAWVSFSLAVNCLVLPLWWRDFNHYLVRWRDERKDG